MGGGGPDKSSSSKHDTAKAIKHGDIRQVRVCSSAPLWCQLPPPCMSNCPARATRARKRPATCLSAPRRAPTAHGAARTFLRALGGALCAPADRILPHLATAGSPLVDGRHGRQEGRPGACISHSTGHRPSLARGWLPFPARPLRGPCAAAARHLRGTCAARSGVGWEAHLCCVFARERRARRARSRQRADGSCQGAIRRGQLLLCKREMMAPLGRATTLWSGKTRQVSSVAHIVTTARIDRRGADGMPSLCGSQCAQRHTPLSPRVRKLTTPPSALVPGCHCAGRA